MKTRDIIKYLSEFSPESKISIVIADPDKDSRNLYPVEEFHVLSKDQYNDSPCFIIGVGKPEPLDRESC